MPTRSPSTTRTSPRTEAVTSIAARTKTKRSSEKRFDVVVIDKGCLVNSIYHYPTNMLFFTTPELLEIGDIPFSSANQKPTREEALQYYRKVADHYKLRVRQYENVISVTGE